MLASFPTYLRSPSAEFFPILGLKAFGFLSRHCFIDLGSGWGENDSTKKLPLSFLLVGQIVRAVGAVAIMTKLPWKNTLDIGSAEHY